MYIARCDIRWWLDCHWLDRCRFGIQRLPSIASVFSPLLNIICILCSCVLDNDSDMPSPQLLKCDTLATVWRQKKNKWYLFAIIIVIIIHGIVVVFISEFFVCRFVVYQIIIPYREILIYAVSQNMHQLWNGIAQNYKLDFDDLWQKYAKNSRIEFAYFSFHVGLSFFFYQLFIFKMGHRK